MAEITALRNNALPYPVYGLSYTVVFPILDADGDLVTGAGGDTPDSEISKNGDTFADCTNELTEIPAGSGMYYLTLTGTEMTADIVTIICKTATAGTKTTPIVLYPRKLVILSSGSSQGGAVGYITLAPGVTPLDDKWNGCLCLAVIDGTTEHRIIDDYDGTTEQASVTPDWNTAPDSNDTYIIFLPEGMQIPATDVVAVSGDDTAADGLESLVEALVLSSSTIETVTNQTEFVIPNTDDATDDDAYEGALAVIIDGTDPNQKSLRLVTDYDSGTRTVTISAAADFTVTTSDTLTILAAATATTVWDRILTGATHNIASSAGRRLRGVQAFGDYANGALWFDSENGVGGQVNYENATVQNPSNSLTDVLAIASSLNMVRIRVAPGSTLTLDATLDGFSVIGENWTLALGSQSVSDSYFHGADVSGIGTGASPPHFHGCHLNTTSIPPSHLTHCGLGGVLTLTGAGDYFLDGCHAAAALPAIDFEDAAENKNVYSSAYGGDLEIRNIGQAGSTDVLHFDGQGNLTLASTCEAATIEIQGNVSLTDNVAGGFVVSAGGTLNDNARYVVTRKGYPGGAVWIDTNASNTGTISYTDGVEHNPVSTLAAATTIAGNLNLQKFVLVPGSSITLAQAYDNFIFDACHSTIALGGQSVNNAIFIGAVITGNDDGSNASHVQYFDCVIGTNTLGQFVMTRCYFTTTLTLAQAGSYFLHQCFSGVAGTSTPALDFGGGLNASNVNMRDYSGGIEIENMGKGTGNYNMSLEGNGQLIINANSTADGGGTSTVAIRGNFTVTDNAGGVVTLSDDARIDVGQINAEVVDALNVDTYAEPGQGAPAATTSLAAKIGYLYKMWRNKKTQDATTFELYNDAGAVVDQKSTLSDDATDLTKGEIATGP